MRPAHRHVVTAGAVAAIVLLAAGCTDAAPDASPSSPAPTASAPASPTPVPYATPTPDPLGIATVTYRFEPAPPERAVSSGPALMVADQPVIVIGECVGDSVDWRLAAADADNTTLLEGAIECGVPVDDGFAYSVPYDGPVQLDFTDTDDVTEAWARVVPAG